MDKGKNLLLSSLDDFDPRSGNLLERSIFNNRIIIIVMCLIITAVLGYQALQLQVNASFQRMIPMKHPYLVNYFENKEELSGMGNAIRLCVENLEGTIYDAAYLETLRKINDDVFFIPGVDRIFMKSIWTPAVRWSEVTEEGMTGGPVMPDSYDGSPSTVEQVRINVEKSGLVGQLIANNYRSSTIFLPLLDINPETGEPLDYQELSHVLEKLRAKYRSDTIDLHITGFAKIVGDLIDGLGAVVVFFAIAVLIATGMVYWFTRCVRSSVLVVVCSLMAVVWQLGLLHTAGLVLDPYSMLVPFLVFSIGMSHGTQKMNGIMQDIGRGTHRVVAARYTFRRLFAAGLTAILSDAVGFAVLMVIQIEVIRMLALAASIGVAILVFTNLIFTPVLLSYTGVSRKAAQRALMAEKASLSGEQKHFLWAFLDLFTQPKGAKITIGVFVVLAIVGLIIRTDLKIGDLEPGAPELRPDSRYNLDNQFINSNYGTSSDILIVMVKTPEFKCVEYDTLVKVDTLEGDLLQLDGVESTNSFAQLAKTTLIGMNEGNMNWYELLPNQQTLYAVAINAPRELFDQECTMLFVFAYLSDHKAETLQRVVATVEAFAKKYSTEDARFLLAAGNAGIEAATNIVVEQSMIVTLLCVFSAVLVMCLITFRSWRAVLAAVIPLMLTCVLCDVLMVWMRIGVKVATLPVVALGVGIGVDYALYVMSVMLARMREGMPLSEAYYRTLLFTGKVVILIGLTLSLAVMTWFFSPIQFQSDMGILLAFMFFWNMLGALVLLPALAYFLMPSKKIARSSKGEKTPKPKDA